LQTRAAAEREGFEPPRPFGPAAFKAAAIVHSATVPATTLPAGASAAAVNQAGSSALATTATRTTPVGQLQSLRNDPAPQLLYPVVGLAPRRVRMRPGRLGVLAGRRV
jgi:hypothetical protein